MTKEPQPKRVRFADPEAPEMGLDPSMPRAFVVDPGPKAEVPQTLYLSKKAFFIYKAEAAVPLELIQGAILEGCLVMRVGRVRCNDIATLLQF